MSIKKKLAAVLLIVAVILLNVGIICHKENQSTPVTLQFSVTGELDAQVSVYYSSTGAFDEEHRETVTYTNAGEKQEFSVNILSDTTFLRLDFDGNARLFSVEDVYFSYKDAVQPVNLNAFAVEKLLDFQGIDGYQTAENAIYLQVNGEDAHVSAATGPEEFQGIIQKEQQKKTLVKNLLAVLFLDAVCLVALRFRKKIFGLPVELYQNRALILNLAKNDFKTKFAGSYLGIFWAFVQPIVTVLVYWFVFQVGLRSGDMNNFPFVLWLVAGLIPWFFFQEALYGGTNALIEYSYLVKKVVFKISTLPLVKVISALFVHLFFIVFMLILYSCYGYFPDLYTLQVVYYTFALFILTLGICYMTSAIVIFFRDLTQIINIVLQVGVWMTPIMWNIDVMGEMMPRTLVLILKANPLYYIVNGYRDALINKVWFWERFDLTCLYWLVTAAVFGLGAVIFKRLKVHFADIL